MLLTGRIGDINFKYFQICRSTLSHAPHLFTNDNPESAIACLLSTIEA
jgi:hypothetical protein